MYFSLLALAASYKFPLFDMFVFPAPSAWMRSFSLQHGDKFAQRALYIISTWPLTKRRLIIGMDHLTQHYLQSWIQWTTSHRQSCSQKRLVPSHRCKSRSERKLQPTYFRNRYFGAHDVFIYSLIDRFNNHVICTILSLSFKLLNGGLLKRVISFVFPKGTAGLTSIISLTLDPGFSLNLELPLVTSSAQGISIVHSTPVMAFILAANSMT